MFDKISIFTRLRLSSVISLAITLALAGCAFLAISAIQKSSETLTSRHYPGTLILSRVADLLGDFRLDEAELELATRKFDRKAQQLAAAAIKSSAEHERAIADLAQQYEPMIDDDEQASAWSEFKKRWQSYLITSRLPGYGDTSRDLYEEADQILNSLIAADSGQVHKAELWATQVKRGATIALAIVAALGVLLSGCSMRAIRNRVSRPLASITKALISLAAGNREVRVPEIGRKDEIGEIAKALEVFRQNAFALEEAHRQAEAAQKKAQALARHDMLTGLPNRRVFSEALEDALEEARLGPAAYAVFLIDLDRFKPVNDSFGHPAGDVVLMIVADRLRKVVRKNDTVARLGGDEFAIIFGPERNSERITETARRLAKEVLATIRAPIALGENQIGIDGSIGIAICPADGTDAESLLRAADIAMYKAKRAGRGTLRFFEQSMDVELRARADLESEVRRAVAGEEIKPFYQPLIDLATGKLLGFEILARWHHPTKGIVLPEVFIPVAEELGVIGHLTSRILHRACLDARAWPQDLMLSLNVSPLQLKDHLFPPQLLIILNETGFSPRRLEIEITESALISDLETAKAVLCAIQAMGVKIALDDFGTGYSSLYHLRELSLDKVKIDRSFVQSMQNDPESYKIVNAILSLTRSLGLPATAEGLEDAEAVRQVIEAGCEVGQGHYFGKAMSPAEAVVFANGNLRKEWASAG
jgi:diguanylate cyclase (GGDEF)-like protein